MAEGEDIAKKIEAFLGTRLGGVLNQLGRQIDIHEIIASSGIIQDIDIDKIIFGEAKIDKVVLEDTITELKSASAHLTDVKINLELKMWLEWSIDLAVFEDSGTESLGSIF